MRVNPWTKAPASPEAEDVYTSSEDPAVLAMLTKFEAGLSISCFPRHGMSRTSNFKK
jgi:hypothetical protein